MDGVSVGVLQRMEALVREIAGGVGRQEWEYEAREIVQEINRNRKIVRQSNAG